MKKKDKQRRKKKREREGKRSQPKRTMVHKERTLKKNEAVT